MIIISHRCNLFGPDKRYENKIETANFVLDNFSFDLELDVRFDGSTYRLGHDFGDDVVDVNLFPKHRVWWHCKDEYTFNHFVSNYDLKAFLHEHEDYARSNFPKYEWHHPNYRNPKSNAILVMLNAPDNVNELDKYAGYCTDYPTRFGDL